MQTEDVSFYGSVNEVKRFVKELTERLLDSGWWRDLEDEAKIRSKGGYDTVAIRTPDTESLANCTMYFSLNDNGRSFRLSTIVPKPGVYGEVPSEKQEAISNTVLNKFIKNIDVKNINMGLKPVPKQVQIHLESVNSRLDNKEAAAADYVTNILSKFSSTGQSPRVLGRRSEYSDIRTRIAVDILLSEQVPVGAPAPAWIQKAFEHDTHKDFRFLSVSEVRGRYFGDLKIDTALYKWLRIDHWFKHQGVEAEMFYSLIRIYIHRKGFAFSEFWTTVERAVRELYPDTALDSRYREGALKRCLEEAQIIFSYEQAH